MSASQGEVRAQAAVATLERNRIEARALLAVRPAMAPDGEGEAFPRSKTFRWLLGHPIGRWVGSAVITGVLTRIPLGRAVGTWLLPGRN